MTQNKKKGIAKKALSISLVAAMLATSNVPVWASGFEAVDGQVGFEVANDGDLLGATIGNIDLDNTSVDIFGASGTVATASWNVDDATDDAHYALILFNASGTAIKDADAKVASSSADLSLDIDASELTEGTMTVALYTNSADAAITTDNYNSGGTISAVGKSATLTVTDTTPSAPVALADVWENISDVTDALTSDIAWNDTAAMETVQAAVGKLATKGAYNKISAEIVFINGTVGNDNALAAGSVENGTYSKGAMFKEKYGNTVAVKLQAQEPGKEVKTFYLTGNAVVDEVDISNAENTVKGWEVTINGKTYKNTDANATIEKAASIADYKVSKAVLYLSDDKAVSVSLADIDDGITFTPSFAVDGAVGDYVKVRIKAAGENTNHLTGTFDTGNAVKIVGKDLKSYVTFGSTSLSYIPGQTAADVKKKLVEDDVIKVDSALTATSDYTVELYSNNSGAKISDGAVIPAGNLYFGVEGAGNYAEQKVINPSPIKVAAKDLNTLVDAQAVIDAISWGGNAAQAKTNIDNALDTIVTYDGKTAFSLGNSNAATEKLTVEITYPTKVGAETVITVTPAKGNTNYTGTKVIRFTPKVTALPSEIENAFKTALNGREFKTYDAKSHVVNNLITGDLSDVSRSQYTLSVKEKPVSEIKDAGTYTIVMTITAGAYKGLTAEYTITIAPRDVTNLFKNGVGVSANTVTYNPDGYGANAKEKLQTANPVFSYNGEVLDENDMAAGIEVVYGTGAAGQPVSATFTGAGNYSGEASSVKLGTIQKKDLNALTLPEIPTQPYNGTTYTSLADIELENAAGVEQSYDEFIVDGKNNAKVDDSNYIVDITNPANGVGTVTVTIRGKGNYTGQVVKTFEVTKNAITADIGTVSGSTFKNAIDDVPYSYEKANSKNGITLADEFTAGTVIVRDRATGDNVTANCEITYKENRAAGTATVEANGKAGYDIYASATFKITPMIITNTVTLKQDNATASDTWAYTGEAIEPKVVAGFTDDTYTLVEGTDYEVSYKENVKAGTGTAKAVVTGKGNYVFANKNNTGVERAFNIGKVTLTKQNVVIKDVEYAGGLQVTPDVTVYNPVTQKAIDKDCYTFEYANGGTNAGSASATLSLTAKGEEGYIASDLVITFMVTKKPLSSCKAMVVNGEVVIKNGEMTVPAAEYTATKNEDGTFTVKAAEKNYTGTITVKELAPEAPTLRVTDRTTSTVSLAWDKVEGAQGYTIWFRSEHDSSVSRKIISNGATTSWTQKGLAAGTKYFYTIKAWVKDAEGNYVFSEQSPVQRGTTKPMAAKITAVSAVNGKVKVTLAGKAAGAEMYSMCYADSRSAFAANNFKVGIRTSYTSRTLNKTFAKGTYYVCVKSYRDLGNGAKVYGAWSNTFKVVVK